jgi:RNA polymerase sigma factor (sigma-70 family)
MSEQDQFLAEAMEREEPRLRSFIRKRVLDTSDAEDVLQDVFYELIAAYRMMQPVEQVTAWMFRVARNRITDLFRRRKTVSLNEPASADEDSAETLEDLLPAADAGPDAVFARGVLLEALDDALEELPACAA